MPEGDGLMSDYGQPPANEPLSKENLKATFRTCD